MCVCVCVCTCVCVWLRSMARCCFGTGSQENKRLGSLRPHQLPSTLGQWRENQITRDHKHLQNKWNVVIWGCCLKMTDVGGGEDCRDLNRHSSGQGRHGEWRQSEVWGEDLESMKCALQFCFSSTHSYTVLGRLFPKCNVLHLTSYYHFKVICYFTTSLSVWSNGIIITLLLC